MQSETSITAKDQITDNWGPEVILTAKEQKTDSKKKYVRAEDVGRCLLSA